MDLISQNVILYRPWRIKFTCFHSLSLLLVVTIISTPECLRSISLLHTACLSVCLFVFVVVVVVVVVDAVLSTVSLSKA